MEFKPRSLCRCRVLAVALIAIAAGPNFPPKGSLGSGIRPVRRIKEADASLSDIFNAMDPVVVELQKRPFFNRSKLRSVCGHRRVSLISPATAATLESLPAGLVKAIDLVLWVLGRSSLEHTVKMRSNSLTLSEYLDKHVAAEKDRPDFWLPYIFRFLPADARMLFEVLLRPLYLHDAPLRAVCPEIMQQLAIPEILSRNWLHFHPDPRVRHETQNNPFVFLGPKDSMSYPMHRNIFPGDVFMLMVTGEKEFCAFHPDEAWDLHPLAFGGEDWSHAYIYDADGMSPDAWRTPRFARAKGWRGTLRAGDLLFLPGSWIHQFQNTDPDMSVGLKFWFGDTSALCSGAAECRTFAARAFGPSSGGGDATVKRHFRGSGRSMLLSEYSLMHSDYGIRRTVEHWCQSQGTCKEFRLR